MTHSLELTVMDLRNPPFPADELSALLSEGERTRAGQFRFPHLQQRFCVGRGMLRHLLAAACNTSAPELCFQFSPQGKPSLAGIHFNVSHSGDYWACAIDRYAPVGVDIERIRPMADHEAIARRFFAPAEYEAIAQYSENERLAAFFRCWTRKESYIKALGEGLSRGLNTFAVSCNDEVTSPVLDSLRQDLWTVESFTPAPGYAGAVSTQSRR